jgi:Leucine-rich repeat (LRR) protein
VELRLPGVEIGDNGAKILATYLSSSKALSVLDLSRNKLTDAAALAFADVLKVKVNASLTKLDLARNQIANAGAIGLAEGLKVNASLTKLYLYNNQIARLPASKSVAGRVHILARSQALADSAEDARADTSLVAEDVHVRARARRVGLLRDARLSDARHCTGKEGSARAEWRHRVFEATYRCAPMTDHIGPVWRAELDPQEAQTCDRVARSSNTLTDLRTRGR